MKTGIVTAYDFLDYGNRLQNYAMHTILSELGLDCETLVPRQNKKTPYRRRENFVREMYKRDPAEAQMKSPTITKQIRFEEFEKRYVPVRKSDTLAFGPGLAKEYSWLVTGGDSVWNPWLRNNLGKMDNHLLAFAQSKQRLCMAPSVAAEELPDHLCQQYHAQWIKFPWLNVRFPEDARLIREVTGREADILMDPVLLVDAARWQELIRPLPDFDEQKPYCLVWFSEKGAVTEEMEKRILELYPDEPCQQYFLGSQGEAPVFSAGPSEFLYLVKNARVLVTNTYYGVVFAAIFGKPFVFSANPQIHSAGQYAVTRQVKALLELLKVSYKADKDCLWAPHIAVQTFVNLPEKARSVDLLKKMFHLDTLKPEQEESYR